ncbi:hypothetical protein SLS60_001723 [Paraconiothyrium brasiliense]|uniref:Uncharacterized protein n=1 Tax=Paraconiothyrium brasiliense TaxID=300254 RepID=A0ABR3S062_9PLEO
MVKVLENRVIDLDLLPGTKKQRGAMKRAKQREEEDEDEWSSSDEYDQGALAHAQHAATALTSSVGGAVKGVVDTAGNTVHAVGTGVFETAIGLGKGLGSVAAYSGSAIGKTLGVGDQYRGNDKKYDNLSSEEVRKAKHEAKRRGKLSDEERWKLEEKKLAEEQRRYEKHEVIRMESQYN